MSQTGEGHRQPPVPRLMLVTDRRRAVRPLPDLVRAAAAGGVDAVQLREKDLTAANLRSLALDLANALPGRTTLLLNGDLALAADLGLGVHLPEAGPDPAEARRALGPSALVGRSVHEPASAARSAGADYLLAGHVFPTPSKPGLSPLGLDGLRRIVAATDLPVLAIGGLGPTNFPSVLATGAHGVAVVAAIGSAPDPYRAARTLRRLFDQEITPMPTQDDAAPAATMTVTANGKPTDLPDGSTVADLLAAKSLNHRLVAVELNGAILPQSAFATTPLSPADTLEIVHFVGGG